MMQVPRRILIVDDNRAIHDDFRKVLARPAPFDLGELESELFGATELQPYRRPGISYELDSAYQGLDGVERVRDAKRRNDPYALAIVDMRMPPGVDGLETITRMWEVDPDIQVVICTAYSDAHWSDIVARFGATDSLLILKKPFDLAEVCQLALALTQKWAIARQAQRQLEQLDRSRAELTAGLALAEAVQEAALDGVLVVGADRRVTTANRKFVEMWRVPPAVRAAGSERALLGCLLDQLAAPDDFIARVDHLHAHPDETSADELRLKDGRLFERWTGPVRSADGRHHGRLWCFRDVTERRKQELAQAVATQRMASLGRLAAGVGHEINNPLTYAMGNIDLLLKDYLATKIPSPKSIVEALAETLDGLQRVQVIVRDLQTLARAEAPAGPVDLEQIADRAIQLAVTEVRHRAQVVRRYEPVPPVIGCPIRLGQVLLNLLINAAQSIPEGDASANRIEVAIRPAEGASIIEVSDTGAGIAPEHLPRIFDPFFTTKQLGSGTGLGLAICREIISSHGGTIAVQSTLGAGTTMTIRLPRAAPEVTAPPAPSPPALAPARRGKLLVIDDEPAMVRLLERVLEEHHDVVTSTSARGALSRIEAGERFDLIVCDLMMPEISGIDFHAHLERHHPALASRIVFMTGGAFTEQAKAFLARTNIGHIAKPFSLEGLVLLVDRFLEDAQLPPKGPA
jgi:signal transduction histidine kinase